MADVKSSSFSTNFRTYFSCVPHAMFTVGYVGNRKSLLDSILPVSRP